MENDKDECIKVLKSDLDVARAKISELEAELAAEREKRDTAERRRDELEKKYGQTHCDDDTDEESLISKV